MNVKTVAVLIGSGLLIYWLTRPTGVNTPLTSLFGFNPNSPPAPQAGQATPNVQAQTMTGDASYT